MKISINTFKVLMSVGLAPDALARVVDAFEADLAEAPKRLDLARSDRNRRYYEGRKERLKASYSDNSDASESVLKPSENVLTPPSRVLDNNYYPKKDNILPKELSSRVPKGEVSSTTDGQRGTALPKDWEPTQSDGLFAVSELGSEAAAQRETENFRDYWRDIPGARGRKKDWSGTYKNWMRRAADSRNTRRSPNVQATRPSRSAHDTINSAMAFAVGGGQDRGTERDDDFAGGRWPDPDAEGSSASGGRRPPLLVVSKG